MAYNWNDRTVKSWTDEEFLSKITVQKKPISHKEVEVATEEYLKSGGKITKIPLPWWKDREGGNYGLVNG